MALPVAGFTTSNSGPPASSQRPAKTPELRPVTPREERISSVFIHVSLAELSTIRATPRRVRPPVRFWVAVPTLWVVEDYRVGGRRIPGAGRRIPGAGRRSTGGDHLDLD